MGQCYPGFSLDETRKLTECELIFYLEPFKKKPDEE